MKAFQCDRCKKFFQGVPFVVSTSEMLSIKSNVGQFERKNTLDLCPHCREHFEEAITFFLGNPTW